MWTIDEHLHWWEFILRGVIVYVFLLVLLRATGKRQIGQLAPFDLVLLLVLSNSVQNAMNGGDNSVTGGMILATTLVAVNGAVGWLTYRNKFIEGIIEGRPVILIHNGKIDHAAMRQVQVTMHELESSLRAAGCADPHRVRFAVLENTGRISIVEMKDGSETA